MAKPTAPVALPVTLQVGNHTGEIGTIEVPFVPGSLDRDPSGRWNVTLEVAPEELRRRIAGLLRAVADEIEKGPADADQ